MNPVRLTIIFLHILLTRVRIANFDITMISFQIPTSFQLFQPTNSFKFTPRSLSLPSDVRTPDLAQILASYKGTTQSLLSVSITESHSPYCHKSQNLHFCKNIHVERDLTTAYQHVTCLKHIHDQAMFRRHNALYPVSCILNAYQVR